jgi:formylglycine-generating enzyme required for sulfatase activity
VRREVEIAFNARTPLLPVRMDGVLPSADLEYFLSTAQWLDAGATFEEGEAARLQAVARDLLEKRPVAADAFGGRRASRRTMAIGAAAGVLALAVGLLVFNAARGSRDAAASDPVRPLESDAAPAAGAPPARDLLIAAGREGTTPPAAAVPPDPTVAPPAGARGAGAPGARPEGGTRDSAIRTRVNPRDGQAYVWIPAGQFSMGCSAGDPDCDSDEQPVHVVTIGKGFWLARTEVTIAQYSKRLEGAPRRGQAGEGDRPVAEVTWAEAKAYCAATGGRLPTEAEWEYAARAGTTARFYGAPAAIAWYAANSGEQAHPVAMKAPNAFGLHDMLGNVAEWVRDRYFNEYDDSGETEEIVEPLASNAFGIARGGSWYSDAGGIRVSRRLEMYPDAAEPIIGFRCAHDGL